MKSNHNLKEQENFFENYSNKKRNNENAQKKMKNNKILEEQKKFLKRYKNREEVVKNVQKEIENILENNKRRDDDDVLKYSSKNIDLVLKSNNKIVDTTNYNEFFNEFDECSEILLKNLEELGYTLMTPIQRLSIPEILKGKDLIGCAQTGSGKTISYLFPIIMSLLSPFFTVKEEKFPRESSPFVLIISPTRELAIQIYKESLKLSYNTNIISSVVYGGEGYTEQIRTLKRGNDIVVGTPGRLINYLERNLINLKNVEYLVIDEADRMFDEGFGRDIERIIEDFDLNGFRKTLMFSATFPKSVIKFMENYLEEGYSLITTKDGLHTDSETPNANVSQKFYLLNSTGFYDKVEALHKLLQIVKGKTIVFVNTKKDIWDLVEILYKKEYLFGVLNGDMEQEKRRKTLDDFTSGKISLLIATDVIGRGIDIDNVDFVINFDMPNNIDSYIHRIGRTGRCGKKGWSATLLTYNDKNIFKPLKDLLYKANQKIPDFLLNC